MTTSLVINDTTTSSFGLNVSDIITAIATNVTEAMEEGCESNEAGCNATQLPPEGLDPLCTRLAPPPVPPWLIEMPARLQELTKHCKSWTLYHELCNSGTNSSTWGYPRHGETSDGEVREVAPPGIQWVIPALALVVLLLLLLLALVLYKHYSRPNKKRMYRVSGAGCRFKPAHSGGSWSGGPLVESETAESYLGQPAAGGGPGCRYARSPVCRLLEQTQYVATPTEDQHRPRPSGPPAFASPAYFLPALSWLRLPILRQAWPGESNSTTGDATLYNAAQPVQCDCGETTHHWPAGVGEGQWAESRTDDEPEYSEIWDGPPQYSALNQAPYSPTNGIGPYEYEMQERANGNAVCECGQLHHHHHYHHHPQQQHRPRSEHFPGNEHRYEKLWQCGEMNDDRLDPDDHCSSSSNPGTCENGWLSRYRLPSPSILASDPARQREQGYAPWVKEGMRGNGLTSDTELLPCECSTGEVPAVAPSDWSFVTTGPERRANGRTEVKYVNPVYEGRGDTEDPPLQNPSPLLSRLWGYMGLTNK